MKLVSVEQMRNFEKEADANGLSYQKMMENAGIGLAKEIQQIAHSQYVENAKLLGLVGPGNNGGDTLIAMCQLAEQKMDVTAYLIQRDPKNDPLTIQLNSAGGKVVSCEEDSRLKILQDLVGASYFLIDGVLGTGFRLPLKSEIGQPLLTVKKTIQGLKIPPVVIAVDCPSGVDSNTGDVSDECIPADYTICMAAIKHGLLRLPAYEYVGELRVVDIGFTKKNSSITTIKNRMVDDDFIRTLAIKRPLDAHKGTFGTALIVAGSLNYTGAALLAGKAAYRVGAGLVTLGVPTPLHNSLAGHFPEATWLLLPHEMGALVGSAASVVMKNFEKTDALLIGCGLGTENTTYDFIESFVIDSSKTIKKPGRIGFVQSAENSNENINYKIPPLVIDADGLKLLARVPEWEKKLPSGSVLTPHPGEMEILTGVSKEKIQTNRLSVATHFAKEWKQVVVLKGAFTIIAAPDGSSATIPVATPALARAGSGDVLAGMIVGFRAQGMDAYNAAVAGAWFHAKAGLLVEKSMGGSTSIMAGDLIDAIIDVIALGNA